MELSIVPLLVVGRERRISARWLNYSVVSSTVSLITELSNSLAKALAITGL